MLRVNHISKKFAGRAVLDDVSFDIAEGSVCALLGKNGEGKTSLIRILTGIYDADNGDVSGNEEISYLPEERGVSLEQTVFDFLVYVARLKGMKKFEAKEKGQSLLLKFGLEDFSKFRIGNLSKGMQQKVQFLSAVICEPQVLVLDEPFSGIDVANVDLFKNEILRLKNQGVSVLLSSHKIDVLEEFCDEFLILDKGKIVFSGSKEEFDLKFSQGSFYVVTTVSNLKIQDGVVEIISAERKGNVTETCLRIVSELSSNELMAALMRENEILSFVPYKVSLSDYLKSL